MFFQHYHDLPHLKSEMHTRELLEDVKAGILTQHVTQREQFAFSPGQREQVPRLKGTQKHSKRLWPAQPR